MNTETRNSPRLDKARQKQSRHIPKYILDVLRQILDIISNQHYVHCRAETTKSSKIIIQQRWDHFSSMEC